MASPYRPAPPPDKRSLLDTLFPVNPLEVAGGLYGLGTQAAGNAASYAASHTPLDFFAPGSSSNPDTQSSANQFGGDVTAMLDSPAHGHVTPSAAAVPIVAAGAKLLPEAETVASTLAKSAEPAAAAAPPIVAYHGSPHSFDRFDMSKIGTGEGAQAYGHGLYFAENENVARGYKSAGQPFYLGDDRRQAAQQLLDQTGGDRNAALALADQNMRGTTKYGEGKMWQDVINNFDDLTSRPPGSMYQVGINADPNSFLDWDKPYNQQSPAVQQALSGIVSPQDAAAYHFGYAPEEFASLPADRQTQLIAQTPSTARDALLPQTGADIVKKFGGGAESADALNKMGISGVKYLDQGSRGAISHAPMSPAEEAAATARLNQIQSMDLPAAKDAQTYAQLNAEHNDLSMKLAQSKVPPPSSNYVLFDDSLASILKKYGLAGLGTAGGAAALTAGGQSPVSSPAEAAPAGASVASPFY